MTAREFDGWKRFDAEDAIGEIRGDLRTAQILAMLANINRDRKSHPQPFGVGEFLLYPEEAALPTEDALGDKILRTLGGAG